MTPAEALACPVCDRWGGHAPECVIGRLQDLGREGRQAHRRALLLVTLLAAGEGVTLPELAQQTGMDLVSARSATRALFAEGLAYPDWSVAAMIHLTTAPHVQAECLAAADLLGMVLMRSRMPISPLLGRAQ
ncbi:hypothetical protein ACMT4L_16775 [Deinococcus sp. A31D244]|uniref:hypothetical protein n=1 Tax=Deinococcus sp. A31D244 TaxID=3397675 RepID=UPI0039DF3D20